MTISEAIKKAIGGGFDPARYGFSDGNNKFDGFFMPDKERVEITAKEEVGKGRYGERRVGTFWVHISQITSAPLFWQSLGKSLGWNKIDGNSSVIYGYKQKEWQGYWHKFIDHLASGGSAESFFETLK